jgi:MFS family permease
VGLSVSLLTMCDRSLSYVSIFVTKSKLPLYNAGIGLCWGVGAIVGPAVGGAFSDSDARWRWAFYINLPLAAGRLFLCSTESHVG